MKRKWPVKTIPQCAWLLDSMALKLNFVFARQVGEHPRMYSAKTLHYVSKNASYAAYTFPTFLAGARKWPYSTYSKLMWVTVVLCHLDIIRGYEYIFYFICLAVQIIVSLKDDSRLYWCKKWFHPENLFQNFTSDNILPLHLNASRYTKCLYLNHNTDQSPCFLKSTSLCFAAWPFKYPPCLWPPTLSSLCQIW